MTLWQNMPMAQIKYSLEAISDLENIFEHIANDSVSNALLYTDKLESSISILENHPLIGIDCKKKLVRRNCRILIVDSYLVFYRFDDKANKVYILRVIRDKQKYQ